MKFIKKLSTPSILIESILMVFIILSFDILFVVKYGFHITFSHWIIAFFNILLVLSVIAFIKNNRGRFIAYTLFILIAFTFFLTDITLYKYKEDVTSIAMLLESGKNTMKIGVKYNPLNAYNLSTWLLIFGFVTAMTLILRRVIKSPSSIRPYRLASRVTFLIVSSVGLLISPTIIDQANLLLFNTPSDKALFVQKFGSITYHVKDIYTYTTNAIKPLIYKDEYVLDINERVQKEYATPSDLHGIAEDMNFIMIMCETCEEYAFSPEYTPNYYRLRDQSMYFTNFFSSAKSNYTYDAEFKSLTSMMYYQGDNFMYTFSDNAYPTALPHMLREVGYTANSFHNYYSDFFNRDEMHLSLGFESYNALEGLDVLETEYWPLDSDMFEQYKDEIAPVQDKPFFSFVMTVTSHGPYDKYRDDLTYYYNILEQDPNYQNESLEYKTLTAAQMNFDEGLGILLDDLEAKGLMDQTVIMMYSDHKNYSSQHLTEEKTPNSDIKFEIEKVPYLIYAKGIETGENNILSSHYDIAPTILDLLGIPAYKDFYYGESIFLNERENRPIILSYSSWIASSYRVQFGNVVYGEVDEASFIETKDEIYDTIQFFEKIFFSDYFTTDNPFYVIDQMNDEIE